MKKGFHFSSALIIFLLLTAIVSAQAPNAIPYQGVARNAVGNILASQPISLRVSIRNLSSSGTVVFSETHSVTTNSLGLFSVNIGTGSPVSGTLATVNWGNGAKFIQVEMDASGGTAYTDMGTTQLNSVPYALYAGKSNDLPAGTANGNSMRWNGTAWVADNALFNDGINVGIGNATPVAKLDVAGNVKITDGSQGAGKVLKSDATGLASWGTLSGTDVLSTALPPTLSCPVIAGSVATGNGPRSVTVSGNYAYVVNYLSNTRQAINISNPTSPLVVGTTTFAPGSTPYSTAVSGNVAYSLLNGTNTLIVEDITNPASPTYVNSVATGSSPQRVALSNFYAFVINSGSNTLQVFSHTYVPPFINTLSLIGTVSLGVTGLTSLAVQGNYAYVTNSGSNTMQVINISNPGSPVVVGSVATGTNPRAVTVSGNYAYVVNGTSNTMQVINIANPALPTLEGTVATGTNPNWVVVSGNCAYVTNLISNTMQVINITNPAAPTVVSTFATGSAPQSVAVSGNYAYVANLSSNTMQAINLLCSGNYAVTINPSTGQTTAIEQQWNNSGTNISNSNAGNVGIGTTTPTNKLDVAGSVNSSTGFKIAGVAASGNYLRGNGTNFVSSSLSGSDLTGIVAIANGGTGTNVAPPNIRLSSNFTTTVNTSTATNLSFNMATGEVWIVEVNITAQCSSTGGVKYAIAAPAGSVVEGWLFSSTSALTTLSHQRITAINTLTTTAVHTIANTPAPDRISFTIVCGGTGGTCSINAASGTAAQTTTLFANSSLTAVKSN